MRGLFVWIAVFGSLLLGSCQEMETIVRIQTNLGDIRVKLYDSTPLHRDNFLKLVRDGYYDSLLFHRVIRDFMIQGGDIDSKNATAGALLGSGSPGYELPAEIKAPHLRGALAAARLPNPANPTRKSNGSQFFIVQGALQTDESLNQLEERLKIKFDPELRALYKVKGGTPQLDGQYTVFGEVVEGLEVLDKIAAVPRDANDRPLEDIRMTMEIEK